jgi:pSer/pThr/pTyr-binding forkhead associated (FHA) protein
VNICKRCGKENQEHYKFCLGCGGELLSSAPPGLGQPGAGVNPAARTMMADPSSPKPMSPPSPLGPPRGEPPPAAPSSLGPPPAGGMQPSGPPPAFAGFAPTPFTPAPAGGGGPPLPGMPPPILSRVPTPGAGVIAPTPFSPPGAGPSPMGAPPGAKPPGAGMPTPLAAVPGRPLPPPSGYPSPQPIGPPPPLGGPGPTPMAPLGAGAGPGAPPSPLAGPPPLGGPPLGSPPLGGPPLGGPPLGGPPPALGAPAPYGGAPPPRGGTPPLGGPTNAGLGAPGPAAALATTAAGVRLCPSCGAEVPMSFAFCGACGTKLGTAGAMPRGPTGDIARATAAAEPKPRGRLTLIRPDGSEGGTHTMGEGENKIGRSHGGIFENDGYLSPLHAEVIVNAAGAVVRDLSSLNGVFVKMNSEEEVQAGDVFRIGQELMRFDPIAPPQPLEDGTEIMGSPNPGYWGRLSVIIGKEIDGSAYPLYGDAVTIGRERGDVNFPDDGYVSGVHARISVRDGKFYLQDLGSSNGTFVKIRGERQVKDGTFVLFGQQLFRINLSV